MGFVPTGHRPIKSRHFYQAGDNTKGECFFVPNQFSIPFQKKSKEIVTLSFLCHILNLYEVVLVMQMH